MPRTLARPGLPPALLLVATTGVLCLRGVASAPPDRPAPEAAERATIHDDFETPRAVWHEEQTDATITLEAHDRSTRAAHDGRTAEHFRFRAGIGSGFYFSYALPKVPITPDLRASLFVRCNRSGAQVFARVVLPSDVDPDTGQPSFLLVPGTIFDSVDRWQRIEVVDLVPAVEQQARVLRATSKRKVSLEGAYVEQLVVNLYSGSGQTEAFLDDLNIGPVPPAVAEAHEASRNRLAAAAEPTTPEPAAPEPAPGPTAPANVKPNAKAPTARVRLDRDQLKRRGEDGLYHDWVFTAVHAPGADIGKLREAGFDVLMDDVDADPERLKMAVDRGFLLMPRLKVGEATAPTDPDQVATAARAFKHRDAVLAWHVGSHLGRVADPRGRVEQVNRVRTLVSRLEAMPAGGSTIVAAEVDDMFGRFTRPPRNLSLVGVRPYAWGATYQPLDVFRYFRQRRDLTARVNPGAFFWASLPATAPPEAALNVWGSDVPPSWGAPIVQPEQVRLMTYSALAAGYRGITYEGDAELTRNSGQMVLLELSLLNAEIDLCESILAGSEGTIPVYNAFDPDPSNLPPPGSQRTQKVRVKPELKPLPGLLTAGITAPDARGVLLLVADYAENAQFQPRQSAKEEVNITVIAPEGAQAFEISPGRVRVLQSKRYVGGTRITIDEFDTTSLILVTSDLAFKERIEAIVNSIRPRAVQMAIEQAELKMAWVTEIHGRLAAEGHYLIRDKERRQRESNGGPISTDAADLLAKAGANIKTARENLEREDYGAAWAEARRASRPLRILMRGLWENAVEDMVNANRPPEDVANEALIRVGRAKRVGPLLLVPPVASAPLVSFNMLPQHYTWIEAMRTAHFGRNLIPSGSFDEVGGLEQAGWSNQGYTLDGVVAKVTNPTAGPKSQNRVVKMVVEEDPRATDRPPPFLDFPPAAIRSPAVPVKAGQFFRISLFVERSMPTTPGAGGVIVRDSLGGDALQFVSSAAVPGRTRVVLYRRAAADGELSVTLGLAGYGEAVFDDLQVERVEAASAAPDVARRPSRTEPASR